MEGRILNETSAGYILDENYITDVLAEIRKKEE